MEYTSNYHLSKPEGDDIINPTSRTGYNGNFDTLDTTLELVSNKANTNESNITTLQGDVTTLWDKVDTLENRDTYSTTEQVIGTWIDGKPIYRRIFTSNNAPIETYMSGTIINDIDTVTKLNITFNTNGTIFNEVWFVPSTISTQHLVPQYVPSKGLYIRASSNMAGNIKFVMIIEYTKTTD